MFMDRKSQYSENEYTTPNRFKLPMVFFRELEQIISQFVWKYKKNSNNQINIEKEECNWRNQPA